MGLLLCLATFYYIANSNYRHKPTSITLLMETKIITTVPNHAWNLRRSIPAALASSQKRPMCFGGHRPRETPEESNSGWPWRPMIEAIRVISQSIHPHHTIRYRLQCRDKRPHVGAREERRGEESSVGKGELASETRTTAWLSPSHGDGGPQRNDGAHPNHHPLGFFLSPVLSRPCKPLALTRHFSLVLHQSSDVPTGAPPPPPPIFFYFSP
jgi:hypothetical protein